MIRFERDLYIEYLDATWWHRCSCSVCGWTSSWLEDEARVQRQAVAHAAAHLNEQQHTHAEVA